LKYRKLGRTGLVVSEIGLGTAQIGGPSMIGGRYIGSPRIEKKEALRILDKAYDSAINFFDTSDKYGDGESEKLLGEAFHKKREKVILATKCGITASGDRCFEKGYLKSCLNQSLKNLKTDYVDVFQLTKPDINLIKSGEIYETLDELKREGKTRFSGVSTGTDEETIQLIVDNKVDALQIFYNLLHMSPNERFVAKAFDAEIGLIVRSPLSSGVLTGKYDYNTRFSEEDDRSLFLYGKTLTSRIDMINKIVDRFQLDSNYNVLHMSLNYLLSNNKISTIIPGVSKIEQLSEILKLCNIERLSSEMFNELENFVKENYEEQV
jgi:aryl-alcohol dehydrogenase-like predicted oxidoreductase